MSEDKGTANGVNNITVQPSPRIPEFNASDPEMWFAVVEAYFTKLKIDDTQQRYLDVLSCLPPRYANEVRDVIMCPLDNTSYASLKTELVKRLSSTQEEKTRKLLENVIMGDEKPSQFLRRLQALAGTAVPESLLKTLWMRGLPEKLKPTMATQQDKPLVIMAEVADTVYSLLPARSELCELFGSTNDIQLATQLQKLTYDMATMKEQLSALVGQISEVSRDSRRGRSPFAANRQNSRPRSGSREPRPAGVCWYHWLFKDAAKKCTTPCSWPSGNCTGSR